MRAPAFHDTLVKILMVIFLHFLLYSVDLLTSAFRL